LPQDLRFGRLMQSTEFAPTGGCAWILTVVLLTGRQYGIKVVTNPTEHLSMRPGPSNRSVIGIGRRPPM